MTGKSERRNRAKQREGQATKRVEALRSPL